MRDLTGAPSLSLDDRDDPEFTFNYLLDCEKKGYLMTCGSNATPSKGIEAVSDEGIYSSHAYAILDVK